MPTGPKWRNLEYRRARDLNRKPIRPDLATRLNQALRVLPTVESTCEERDGMVCEVRHRRLANGWASLHIVGYTPKAEASIVPMTQQQPEADLDVAEAPEDSEFMDGDFMLVAHQNHAVLCPSGLRWPRVEAYLRDLLLKTGQRRQNEIFSIEPIADKGVARDLANDGVKSIRLGAELYSATLEEDESRRKIERRGFKERLSAELTEVVLSILNRRASPTGIAERENLSAELVVRFDRRRRGGEMGGERIKQASLDLLENENEGFVIETRSGAKIHPNKLAIRKPIGFSPYGQTIHHVAAWEEMVQFYRELAESGALDA